jgi:lysozyme family protein
MRFTGALRNEYRRLFHSAKVRPERRAAVQDILESLVAHKRRYESAGHPVGVPWWFVAVIHDLEASRNFQRHLHNGDPLTHKTVHVPKGRPAGTPPFTWEESARDALRFDGLAHVADWSISHSLFRLEGFNGFGYRSRRIKTPYLWSFSQHYTRGKFASDGHFDANLVSQQCGAGVLLRVMVDNGHVTTLPTTATTASTTPTTSAHSATAPSVPFPGRILKLTRPLMSGDDVHAYQARLHTLGFPITIDSHYGEQSKRTTKRFQDNHGLVANGEVGQNTWNAAFTE